MSSMRSNSSGRTTSSRRNSSSEKEALILDCKAAYLVLYEDLNTEIESKEDLYKGDNNNTNILFYPESSHGNGEGYTWVYDHRRSHRTGCTGPDLTNF